MSFAAELRAIVHQKRFPEINVEVEKAKDVCRRAAAKGMYFVEYKASFFEDSQKMEIFCEKMQELGCNVTNPHFQFGCLPSVHLHWGSDSNK